MVATNICEWLYTLVAETKHEIWHLAHFSNKNDSSIHVSHTNSTRNPHVKQDCQRTNIMGTLVQDTSPFLFPCTIEFSLICAVILYEMWKKIRLNSEITIKENSVKESSAHQGRSIHHFSIDCSKAHRGVFAGVIVIALTIIILIMYFVLHNQPEYANVAIAEVTYYEIILYTICSLTVVAAFVKMRDLKFRVKTNGKINQLESYSN